MWCVVGRTVLRTRKILVLRLSRGSLLNDGLHLVRPERPAALVRHRDVVGVHLLEQAGDVRRRRLDHLDLPDVNVTQGEDAVARLGDLRAHNVLTQDLHDLVQGVPRHGVRDDLRHLRADLLHVRRLAVAVLLHLAAPLLREADGEHAERVAVRRLHLEGALNEGAPLGEERLQLVRRQGHAVEVGDHVAALHVLGLQRDLAVRVVTLGVHQVGEAHLEHAALDALRTVEGTLRLVDDGLAAVAGGELHRGDQVEPLLVGHGVLRLPLLGPLATLRQTLVLADGHCVVVVLRVGDLRDNEVQIL
eukprot:Rhum_TRINITY_DN9233_c0_g1::Rhum_TRINITY_DN9233_c0_g1_i1::g.32274::m.32274